jgi:hypothetical protein
VAAAVSGNARGVTRSIGLSYVIPHARWRRAPPPTLAIGRTCACTCSRGCGARTLASLRTEDVDQLVIELDQEGKAAGTVRNVIVPLRKLLADAVRQGKLPSNPAAKVDLPPAQDFVGVEIPSEHTDAIRGRCSRSPQRIRTGRANVTSSTSCCSTRRSAPGCGSAKSGHSPGDTSTGNGDYPRRKGVEPQRATPAEDRCRRSFHPAVSYR